VATYDEVLSVLRDPVTYSSETGGTRPYGGTIIEDGTARTSVSGRTWPAWRSASRSKKSSVRSMRSR
jgi:hypothetical protein